MLKLDFIRRCGAQVVRFAESNVGGPISEALLNSLGFYVLDKIKIDLIDRVIEIQPVEAQQIVARMLHKDLAYNSPGNASLQECEDFALDWFADREANGDQRYFSNGNWLGFWAGGRGDWEPLTKATFDGGVIAVSSDSSASIWFEAED